MRIKLGQKAQTAIELAVFGAIVIFVLSTTVRSALSRGVQQNAILRATRMALTMSYNTSASLTTASRNTASVLIVEDRLTADSGKYGAVDRVPTLMQGTATHSANLFMPVDFGDADDIPVMDVFVNGQHFEFTTVAFATKSLPSSCPGGSPCGEWEDNCVGTTTTGPCANLPPVDCVANGCTDCSPSSVETYSISSGSGCAKLYTVIDNHPLFPRWCAGGGCPVACSVTPIPGCNLSEDERFDLDRDDLDGIPGDNVVPVGDRQRFAWQWFLVAGFDESTGGGGSGFSAANLSSSGPPPGPVTSSGLLIGEGINVEARKNILVDVDQDLKMELIEGVSSSGGRITSVNVRDFQDGDVDLTHHDGDLGPSPGFTNDIKVYTFVKDAGPDGGTFLEIDEGKLYTAIGDTKQYVRTASKKDQADMIERVFHISNNTGRFCTPGGVPVGGTPVQVCGTTPGECFTSANIGRTCLDMANLMIFIRSWIADFHGRKWVTDYNDDPFIDFVR